MPDESIPIVYKVDGTTSPSDHYFSNFDSLGILYVRVGEKKNYLSALRKR